MTQIETIYAALEIAGISLIMIFLFMFLFFIMIVAIDRLYPGDKEEEMEKKKLEAQNRE